MTKYVWRNKHHFGYVDPEIAAIELERIRKEHDGLRPAEIVDEARPAGAPLHPAFEWDNSSAAEEYRKIQARTMVRSIHIHVDDDSNPEPIYVNISTEDDRKYESVQVVLADEDLFAKALNGLRRNLDAAERAFEELYNMADTNRRQPLTKVFDTLQEARRIIEREVAVAEP